MSTRDVKSVGLTPEGKAILDDIEDLDWFPTREAAAKFALGLAVRAGAGAQSDDRGDYAEDVSGAKTGWALGNFDPDGEITSLLESLYPECETPVRLMRTLINDGLLLLQPRLSQAGKTPLGLFADEA